MNNTDVNNATQQGEFSTMADWNMKSILLNQYAIAYNNLVDYITEPDKQALEKAARKSVMKLLYPLFPKLYVLGSKSKKERDYLSYFMWHPDRCGLMELQASFLILQKVMEKLGITRFENYKLPQTEVYDEK